LVGSSFILQKFRKKQGRNLSGNKDDVDGSKASEDNSMSSKVNSRKVSNVDDLELYGGRPGSKELENEQDMRRSSTSKH
jgi:hypothetical protein